MKVFVTGATGFVGKALINELLNAGHNIVAGVRNYSVELPVEVEQKLVGDLSLLSEQNTIIDTLKKIDVVIHTAARGHIMQDKAADPLTEFRKMNVNATLALAKQSVSAGVKRFVFISSIKVNGESTNNRQAFRETDKPAPEDAYGQFGNEQNIGAIKDAISAFSIGGGSLTSGENIFKQLGEPSATGIGSLDSLFNLFNKQSTPSPIDIDTMNQGNLRV